LAGQQTRCLRRRRVRGGLKGDISRNHHNRDAAITHGLPDRNLQNPGHLIGSRDQLAIMTALLEQRFRMSFLEIPGAELGRWDLRRNRKHRRARPLAIEEAIDEGQIAGSTAAGANRKLSCQVRLGSGSEGRGLLVTQMYPIDLALTADCIGQPVQAVADDTIDPFHAGDGEDFCKLVSDGFGRDDVSACRDAGHFAV
jgi:hypothetical protein